MARDLSISLHEWFSASGAWLYNLQDRIWYGVPADAWQASLVPSRLPHYWYAYQSSCLFIILWVFFFELCLRPPPTRSFARWSSSALILNDMSPNPQKVYLP